MKALNKLQAANASPNFFSPYNIGSWSGYNILRGTEPSVSNLQTSASTYYTASNIK